MPAWPGDCTGFVRPEVRVHTCPLPSGDPEPGETFWRCPRCARRWYWSMRQVDGREFHGWAPMRESLEDRVRRVELDERRRVTRWAAVFTISACSAVAAVVAIIVMLAQVS